MLTSEQMDNILVATSVLETASFADYVSMFVGVSAVLRLLDNDKGVATANENLKMLTVYHRLCVLLPKHEKYQEWFNLHKALLEKVVELYRKSIKNFNPIIINQVPIYLRNQEDPLLWYSIMLCVHSYMRTEWHEEIITKMVQISGVSKSDLFNALNLDIDAVRKERDLHFKRR